MKLRVMANESECLTVQKFFENNLSSSIDYSISKLYPCRNSNLFRLYIDITIRSINLAPTNRKHIER